MTNAIAPKFVEYPDGLIVLGDFPSKEVASIIFTWLKDVAKVEKFPLVIADPPYGNILNEEWDETGVTDVEFADFMFGWTEEGWDVASKSRRLPRLRNLPKSFQVSVHSTGSCPTSRIGPDGRLAIT
jgi:hypothetical protein